MLKWLIYILKNLKRRSFMEGYSCKKKEDPQESEMYGRVEDAAKGLSFCRSVQCERLWRLREMNNQKEIRIIQNDYISHQTSKPGIHLNDIFQNTIKTTQKTRFFSTPKATVNNFCFLENLMKHENTTHAQTAKSCLSTQRGLPF